MVGASDRPMEFLVKKDKITQAFFSGKFIDLSEFDKCNNELRFESNENKSSSKVTSTYPVEVILAFLDEIEEETLLVDEVTRIKEIIKKNEVVSESEIYKSLRKLQLMGLPAHTLIQTMIGNSVHALRNHGSQDVRQIAGTLDEEWKDRVTEWKNTTGNINSEGGEQCSDSCLLDEMEGLPCPPLDDFAIFNAHTSLKELLDLSAFFDGVDDHNSAAVMDDSRKQLGNANSDTYEIIEKETMVAASDHPKEFRIKRDNIAQTLFSCELNNCSGCEKCKKPRGKVVEETKMVGEVLRIKKIVDRNRDDSILYRSLSKLHDMQLSVKILEASGIGRSISDLQNHASMDVRQIARMLIKAWRHRVDESVDPNGDEGRVLNNHHRNPATDKEADRKLQVSEKRNIQNESVPTPEQNANNQQASAYSQEVAEVLRIKKFLDKSGDESEAAMCDLLMKLDDMRLSVKTLETTEIGKSVRVLQKHASNDVRQIAGTLMEEWKVMLNECMNATVTKSVYKATPKELNPSVENKVNKNHRKPPLYNKNAPNCKQQLNLNTERKLNDSEKANTLNGPLAPDPGRKGMGSEYQEKLEATKRKLQQGYEEAEKNKRQRKVQIMEVDEVMKRGLVPKNFRRLN